MTLTLDELRQMDGEPVYCLGMVEGLESAYGLVYAHSNYPYVRTHKGGSDRFFYFATFGAAWRAYRRKPKEE